MCGCTVGGGGVGQGLRHGSEYTLDCPTLASLTASHSCLACEITHDSHAQLGMQHMSEEFKKAGAEIYLAGLPENS